MVEFKVGQKVKVTNSDHTNPMLFNRLAMIVNVHKGKDTVDIQFPFDQIKGTAFNDKTHYFFDKASARLEIVEDVMTLEPHLQQTMQLIANKKAWKVSYSTLESLINLGFVNCMGRELTEQGKRILVK